MTGQQLGLDLTPLGAHAVADRVRLLRDSPMLRPRAGMVGTVTKLRPVCGPADHDRGHFWAAVLVLLDGDQPGGEYAFEHEDLEVVDGR